MKIKDLRITIFYKLLRPFAKWSRKRRMRSFVNLMDVREGMSILDLGGQLTFWDNFPLRLNLTVLNLPGSFRYNVPTYHNICYVEADACNIGRFDDGSFDLVFSNSVIEHVGSAERQARFAREARRCGRSYWIQTPSKWFPIEAHCGMPFWWFYPVKLRDHFLKGWRNKYPEWAKMVEGTTVLSKADLIHFFPEATLWTETFCGLSKSYVMYFREPNRAERFGR